MAKLDFVIGELAVTYKMISLKQLDEAKAEQNKSYEQSGKEINVVTILEGKGYISIKQIKVLNKVRQFLEIRDKDLNFAEYLIKKDVIDKAEFKKIFIQQAKLFKDQATIISINDLLIQDFHLDKDQMDELLVEYKSGNIVLKKTLQNKKASPKTIADKITNKKVDGVDEEKEIELKVSENLLSAHIFIAKDYLDKYKKSMGDLINEIKDLIEKKGIVFGIVKDPLLLDGLKVKTKKRRSLAVATGKVPIPGKNASIVYHFNKDSLNPGKVPGKETNDLKDRGAKPSVKKGALLAEKIPAIEGKNGTNIFGDDLSAPDVVDVSIQCGKGAELSEDGHQALALIDGQPQVSIGGEIEVLPE